MKKTVILKSASFILSILMVFSSLSTVLASVAQSGDSNVISAISQESASGTSETGTADYGTEQDGLPAYSDADAVHNDKGKLINLDKYPPTAGLQNGDFQEGFKYWSFNRYSPVSGNTYLSQEAHIENGELIFDDILKSDGSALTSVSYSGIGSTGFTLPNAKVGDEIYVVFSLKNVYVDTTGTMDIRFYAHNADGTTKSGTGTALTVNNGASSAGQTPVYKTFFSRALTVTEENEIYSFVMCRFKNVGGGSIKNIRIMRKNSNGTYTDLNTLENFYATQGMADFGYDLFPFGGTEEKGMPSTNSHYVHNDAGASIFTYYKPSESYLNFDFSAGFKYWSVCMGNGGTNQTIGYISDEATVDRETGIVTFKQVGSSASSKYAGISRSAFKINGIKSGDVLYLALDVRNTDGDGYYTSNNRIGFKFVEHKSATDGAIQTVVIEKDGSANLSDTVWQTRITQPLTVTNDNGIFSFKFTRVSNNAGIQVKNFRIYKLVGETVIDVTDSANFRDVNFGGGTEKDGMFELTGNNVYSCEPISYPENLDFSAGLKYWAPNSGRPGYTSNYAEITGANTITITSGFANDGIITYPVKFAKKYEGKILDFKFDAVLENATLKYGIFKDGVLATDDTSVSASANEITSTGLNIETDAKYQIRFCLPQAGKTATLSNITLSVKNLDESESVIYNEDGTYTYNSVLYFGCGQVFGGTNEDGIEAAFRDDHNLYLSPNEYSTNEFVPNKSFCNSDFSEGFKYWSLIYNKENSTYTKLSQIASYNRDTKSVTFDKAVNFTNSGMISQGFRINQYVKVGDTLYAVADVKNTPENSGISVSLDAYDISNGTTIKGTGSVVSNASDVWQSVYSSGINVVAGQDGEKADMAFYFTITKDYGEAGGEVSNLRILRADRGGLKNAPMVTLNGLLLENQVYGDANYDNKFDLVDLVRTKKYLVGKSKAMFLSAVDFNNDDVVAADDISLMINMLLDPKGNLMITDSYEKVSFSSLALGSVQAKSWLKNQLVLQAENIVSDFELMSPDCKATGDDRSGWLGGTGENWERGPYYIRGLVSTAYVLQDNELKNKAQKWIDWILESQNESGAFGPYANDIDNFDYWSVMPVLIALEDYYDATGDQRVIPFLEKYFAWQTVMLPTKKLQGWPLWRACDNILAVYWLYEKTGDESLIDLCQLLYSQSYRWDSAFNRDALASTLHIVNVNEGIKMMPVMYSITGNEYYLESYYNGIENLYMRSGRQDGMSNGDENTKGIGADHGTEICAIAERILSEKIALYTFADASVADALENVAYNALPQQLLPDGRGYSYYTIQNQVDASLGHKGFSTDYGNCLCYGIPSGFPCCAHNFMMAWPQFISSMWMKTSDNGLAVGAYGPNTVTAEIEGSGNITIVQETNYPYEDTVKLTVNPDKPLSCPIYLRVPEWCDNATLKVNGKVQNVTLTAGEYVKLSKRWMRGDVIELTFPMEFEVNLTQNNSISVKYGAVLFAVQIEENWEKITYTNNYNREWNYLDGKYSNYNITAASDWNLALSDFDFKNIASNFTISRNTISDDMRYIQSDAPIVLTANGVKVNDWTVNSKNVAEAVPVSPVASERLGENVQITLIPYAFTKLRVALIPWTGEDDVTFVADENNADKTSVKFSSVIVPYEEKSGSTESDTYSLCVNYSSSEYWTAKVYINKQYYCDVEFSSGTEFAEIGGLTSNYSEYHNIVEFRRNDGTVPTDFNAVITVVKEE